MLRDEIALYTELSGNDGEHTAIGIIGAYLDGYEKGKETTERRWIPCSEKLPEENDPYNGKLYIVTTDTGKTNCMRWETEMVRGKKVSRWKWQGVLSPWKVIAWMPLPDAYREVRKDNV